MSHLRLHSPNVSSTMIKHDTPVVRLEARQSDTTTRPLLQSGFAMMRPWYISVVLSALSVATAALPDPSLHLDDIHERRAISSLNVCQPLPTDKNLPWIWKNYGMGPYLHNFTISNDWRMLPPLQLLACLTALGNWANRMEAQALGQDSVLFCTTVDSDSCAQPQSPCSAYKPPQGSAPSQNSPALDKRPC